MVIHVSRDLDGKTPEQVAFEIIGKRVFIQWPFLMEALVSSVSDELFLYQVRIAGSNRELVKTPHSPDAQVAFSRVADKLEYEYSKRYGVEIGPTELVVQVRPIKGMKLMEDGSRRKEFADTNQLKDVAWQTLVYSVDELDPRYAEHGPVPVDKEFPIGSRVFFLGKTSYGSVGEVTGHQGETVTLKLLVPRSEEGENLTFGNAIARKAEVEEKFQPSWAVAKALEMSALVLSKITSSLHVISKESDQKVNLGLNLKFESKKKKVLGYSQKSERGWEFSQTAMKLIKAYKDKFPEVFRALDKKGSAPGEFYEDAAFVSDPKQANKRMIEIVQWLKEQGVKELDSVPLETESLTKEYVKMIEETVDAEEKNDAYKLVTVKNIPRMAVLKPAHAKDRLDNQKFRIGDRVVFAEDTGGVPMGLKGTVIGLTGNVVDVLFDKTFLNGNSLGGRCSALRGMTVWGYSLMNLSRMQPPKGQTSLVAPISEAPRANSFKNLARPDGGVVAQAKMIRTAPRAVHPGQPRPVHSGQAHSRPNAPMIRPNARPQMHHGPVPGYVPRPFVPVPYPMQPMPYALAMHSAHPRPAQARPVSPAARAMSPPSKSPPSKQVSQSPKAPPSPAKAPSLRKVLPRPAAPAQPKELSSDLRNLLGVKEKPTEKPARKEAQTDEIVDAADALKTLLKIEEPKTDQPSESNRGRGGRGDYRGRGGRGDYRGRGGRGDRGRGRGAHRGGNVSLPY